MATLAELKTTAVAQYQAGNLAQAEALLRQILQMNPHEVDCVHLFGLIAHQVGKNDIAVDYLRQTLRLHPNHAQAHNNLGIVLESQGKLEEALASFKEAVRLQPNYPPARGGLGNAQRQLGLHDEGLANCAEAVRLDPTNHEAHNSLGSCYLDQGKTDEAVACFQESLRLRPDFVKARNNLGAAYIDLGRIEEGIAYLQEVLRLKPDYADAHNNLGNALTEVGNLKEALACYEQSAQLSTQSADTHLNLGLAYLLRGNFERGWPEYEWRWRRQESLPRPFRAPLWDGSPLAGRTILIHAEQGLGDTLHFIRYAPLLKERGARVIVECQKPLLNLLAKCRGVDQLVGVGSPFPAFDVHAPFLSVPRILGTNLTTIPGEIPYVFADEDLIEHWRRELEPQPGFKIGIAWQGNPKHKKDRMRSIPLAQFAPLADVPDVRLLSLQKGLGTEQIPAVADRFAVNDLGSRLDEANGAFMDTAAVMKSLDLVVTSDTATAHLAGALGVPVWVALPFAADWRWLLGRTDSPWYPTMRLFRQEKRGDWTSVFECMAEALRDLVNPVKTSNTISVAVAPGELIDKITILEIKSARITDAAKLTNVRIELDLLNAARARFVRTSADLDALTADLKAVNERLWDIEDDIRLCERDDDFGPRFIELARSVYRSNDHRAALKRRINDLLGSTIVEEKSYADYGS